VHLESVQARDVDQFFQTHRDQFAPDAIYRAKTWGRFQAEYQLSFVDLGLMPVVEEQIGTALGGLIERNVSELKRRLAWDKVTSDQGHWLLQSIFWLVSAKILRDKQVASFGDLDLSDVDEVFRRLGHHYGTKPLAVRSRRELLALGEAARTIGQFSSLVLTTTEALAYVYENTLISKETRAALGTHSTPSFLVDYVVGNLAEWVKEIPVHERSVFEPACGHAAFLVSAMRLLTDILPPERAIPSRRGPYLRRRLHGTDVDPFALELARLSLTLTDIPNPDGWDLRTEDMFLGDRLAVQAGKNTILLANPPFDNFTPQEKLASYNQSPKIRFVNKSSELLWRTLPRLPQGGVFGVIVPQTILHSKSTKDLRKTLVEEFELKEICLFPDKVFSFSDAESAVVLGRRKKASASAVVSYRRIRERGLTSFRRDPSLAVARDVPQSRFSSDDSFSLSLPDLEEVWSACSDNPILQDLASVAQGLTYRGHDLAVAGETYSSKQFPASRPGFVRFDGGLQLHELPSRYWMDLRSSVIGRPRSGTLIGTPQVLLNYAPASRGPWRLKALIDRQGHPVTSRFITVRPKKASVALEMLWALLNSPVANAYAYSHLGKRDNIVGDIRQIPLPKGQSFPSLERLATAYLEAASGGADPAELETLLLCVDAEVLRLYDFGLDTEQRILGLFNGWTRVGVPFNQERFLPTALEENLSLSEFLKLEQDWHVANRERGQLIDKKIAGKISAEEQVRLDLLQAYADYHIHRVSPRPTRVLDELERRLNLDSEGRNG
jgi:hypothetical protein